MIRTETDYDRVLEFGYKKGVNELEKKLLTILEEWRLTTLDHDTKYILDAVYDDIRAVAAQLKTEV